MGLQDIVYVGIVVFAARILRNLRELIRKQGGCEIVEHNQFALWRNLPLAEEIAYGLFGREIASGKNGTHYAVHIELVALAFSQSGADYIRKGDLFRSGELLK